MRNALLVVSAAVATVVMGAAPGAGAPAGVGTAVAEDAGSAGRAEGRRVVAPEADVAHHGHASLWAGRLRVGLVTLNHGPAGLTETTVRVRLSAPMAPGQELPPSCVRADERAVVCGTSVLPADGRGREVSLDLTMAGTPAEVVVEVDTTWSGGASDRNPGNDRHRVLTLATGDPYVF